MEEHEEINNLNRHYSVIETSEARRQTIAKISILLVVTLERFAYYSLVSSFYLFLNEGPWHKGQSWDLLEALNAVFILLGISYLSALLGGYISDAYLGRFKTIVLGFIFYIIGYVLLTLISIDKLPRYMCSEDDNSIGTNYIDDKPKAPCRAVIYLSLTILGLGNGTVKSNIAPFGAEQLRSANSHKIRSFFNWFYWCVNIGSLIGIGAIGFIEQDNPGICTNGFFCGYFIGSICLLVSLILFLCAYPWYYMSYSEGSLLRDIVKIILEAIKANFRHWRYNRRNPNLSPLHVEPAFLDRAKIRYGGSFHEGAVDDVNSLGKLVAVFCALIPYWIVNFQMETSFQAQGLHMRFADFTRNNSGYLLGSSYRTNVEGEWRFSVPAAWLTLFNQTFIIFAIPVLTTFLYPKLDRAGIRLSLFFRIGVGMVLSMLAVMAAGGLESYRILLWRTDPTSHIDLVIGNVTYHAVNISIFWQIPQYVLIGAAEVFANIAGLEFAYTAAPATFQGLIMGLFYSLEGCASFLGILLLRLISPYWFNHETDNSNINDNHLDFYLYFLGIIQFTTLAAFSLVLYTRRFALRLVGMPPSFEIRRPRDISRGSGNAAIAHSGETDETETEMERSENEFHSSMNEDDYRRPLIL